MASIIISFTIYFLIIFGLYFFAIRIVSDEANPTFIRIFSLSSLLTAYAYLSYVQNLDVSILVTLFMWFIIFFILGVNFIDYIYISIIVGIGSYGAMSFLGQVIDIINKYI